MRLEFSPAADADLVAIASFIARDNIPRAITLVDELEAACFKLTDFPQPKICCRSANSCPRLTVI